MRLTCAKPSIARVMPLVGDPFDGSGTVTTPFALTGLPGSDGSAVELALDLPGLEADTRYHWRARRLSPDPLAKRSPWFTDPGNGAAECDFRTGSLVAVAEGPSALGNSSVIFLAPAPVPFATQSTLSYSLARSGEVRVAVYDVTGRRLALLADEHQAAGAHRLSWNGTADDGRRAASGVYFAVVDALGERHARRLVLTR